MWLLRGRPTEEEGCRCQYCSGRTQEEVSAELFGYLLKGEVRGEQGEQKPSAGKKGKGIRKRKPADEPIVAKDYRQGI